MPVPDQFKPDPRDYSLLIETVREAGALALTMFRQTVRRWIKPDGSPVTEVDMAVDKLLRTRLRAARPDYGWLSEETPDSSARLAANALWIADPIDGTRAFVNGTDEWCVAVALVVAGKPVLGVVYRPVIEEFYKAGLGMGAWLNEKPLVLPDKQGLDGAKVAGSASVLRKLATHGPIEQHARTSVPLALRLCHVASQTYNAAVSPGNKNDWDLAAGDVIVHEAGGKVTGIDGQPYVYNRRDTWQKGLVAGSVSLHRKIISVMGTGHGNETG